MADIWRMVLINPDETNATETITDIPQSVLLAYALNLSQRIVRAMHQRWTLTIRSSRSHYSPQSSLTLLRCEFIKGFGLVLAQKRFMIVLRIVRIVLEMRLMR